MKHDQHWNAPPRRKRRGRQAAIDYMVKVQGRKPADAKLKYDSAGPLIRQHMIDRAVEGGFLEAVEAAERPVTGDKRAYEVGRQAVDDALSDRLPRKVEGGRLVEKKAAKKPSAQVKGDREMDVEGDR